MFDWTTLIITALEKLAWPLLVLWIVWNFRAEVRQLLVRLKRGRFMGSEFEIDVQEPVETRGPKTATITARAQPQHLPDDLTQLQSNILKEFLQRGDYDSMEVSRNLYPDFLKLKEWGLLRWEGEQPTTVGVKVNQFGLTEKGKQVARGQVS